MKHLAKTTLQFFWSGIGENYILDSFRKHDCIRGIWQTLNIENIVLKVIFMVKTAVMSLWFCNGDSDDDDGVRGYNANSGPFTLLRFFKYGIDLSDS